LSPVGSLRTFLSLALLAALLFAGAYGCSGAGTVPSRCSWSTRRLRPRPFRRLRSVRHPTPWTTPTGSGSASSPALRAHREVVPPFGRPRGDRRDPARHAHRRRSGRVRQYGDPLRRPRPRRPAAGPRVVQRHHPLPGRGEDGPGRDVRERDDRHGLRRPGVGRFGHSGDAGDGGLDNEARLGNPIAVKVGPDDAIYVSSSAYRKVKRIDRYGYVSNFAGDGFHDNIVIGAPAVSAPIGAVQDIDIDPAGTFTSSTTSIRSSASTTAW